jgi:hypothetical protein
MMRRLSVIHPEIEVKTLGQGRVEIVYREPAGNPRAQRMAPAEPERERVTEDDEIPSVRSGLSSPA